MVGARRRLAAVGDIAAALALALLGALAVAMLPDGSMLRILLVTPILLFSPGYLLLQACLVPARPVLTRVFHGVLSVGVSLSVVGLVALSTAVVRGAFRPAVIVLAVTLACVALAATGIYRRLYQPTPAVRPEDERRPLVPRLRELLRRRRHEEPVPPPARPEPARETPAVMATSEALPVAVAEATSVTGPGEELPITVAEVAPPPEPTHLPAPAGLASRNESS